MALLEGSPIPAELRSVTVPPGVSGLWSVEHCDTYTQLSYSGHVAMTDVPFELETHREPVIEAKRQAQQGDIRVLLNGLGLGLILQAMLSIRRVVEITVIEKSADVIALVAGHYADPRLTVIEADAYLWEPPAGACYGVVWHDVWPTLHPDNLVGIACLERVYDGLSDWQGSWPSQRRRRWGRAATSDVDSRKAFETSGLDANSKPRGPSGRQCPTSE